MRVEEEINITYFGKMEIIKIKKGNKTKQEEGNENKCIDCGMELREMSRIPPKLMFSKGRKIIRTEKAKGTLKCVSTKMQ